MKVLIIFFVGKCLSIKFCNDNSLQNLMLKHFPTKVIIRTFIKLNILLIPLKTAKFISLKITVYTVYSPYREYAIYDFP